jgi:hypothetical protein
MSEVISFRLDATNPREARALEILNGWIEQGYSIRFILVQALLALDHTGPEQSKSVDSRDMELVLNQIGLLLELLKAREPNLGVHQDPDCEPSGLQENFLAAIKQSAKPGIKRG